MEIDSDKNDKWLLKFGWKFYNSMWTVPKFLPRNYLLISRKNSDHIGEGSHFSQGFKANLTSTETTDSYWLSCQKGVTWI